MLSQGHQTTITIHTQRDKDQTLNKQLEEYSRYLRLADHDTKSLTRSHSVDECQIKESNLILLGSSLPCSVLHAQIHRKPQNE